MLTQSSKSALVKAMNTNSGVVSPKISQGVGGITNEAMTRTLSQTIVKKKTLGLGETIPPKIVIKTTDTEVKAMPVGSFSMPHPIYLKGTPMNKIYLELKKDGETYISSQVEEYRNIADSLAKELIPNFLKQVDDTFIERSSYIKMRQGGLEKLKESIAEQLLPKFKSDFKSEAKKRIGAMKPKETPKETPKEPTTTTTTTTTEVTDTKPKSDNDKMILYGGIALVIIAILMSK
jgi:hypothetical protein